jgi:hypothetical protein
LRLQIEAGADGSDLAPVGRHSGDDSDLVDLTCCCGVAAAPLPLRHKGREEGTRHAQQPGRPRDNLHNNIAICAYRIQELTGPKLSAKAKWQKAYYDRLATMTIDERRLRPRFDGLTPIMTANWTRTK